MESKRYWDISYSPEGYFVLSRETPMTNGQVLIEIKDK